MTLKMIVLATLGALAATETSAQAVGTQFRRARSFGSVSMRSQLLGSRVRTYCGLPVGSYS